MAVPVAPASFRPLGATTTVCGPLARPLLVKTACLTCVVALYRSTTAATPSTVILALPSCGSLTMITVTAVPSEASVAGGEGGVGRAGRGGAAAGPAGARPRRRRRRGHRPGGHPPDRLEGRLARGQVGVDQPLDLLRGDDRGGCHVPHGDEHPRGARGDHRGQGGVVV